MRILPLVRGKPMTFSRATGAIRSRLFVEKINACRGVFDDFCAAECAAPKTKPLGYEAANSNDWYLGKMVALQLEDYPVVFWLREALGERSSLLEVGGHIGEAFYAFELVLAYPPELTWTIFDVPSVAAAGASLARERGCTNLRFITNFEKAENPDILLACGAIQYLDYRTPAHMIESLQIRPRHILINTTPIYDGPSFVTIQNIGSVYCPYRVFNRNEIVQGLGSAGYVLIDSWQKERKFRIPRHPDKSFDHYSGLYFRLR